MITYFYLLYISISSFYIEIIDTFYKNALMVNIQKNKIVTVDYQDFLNIVLLICIKDHWLFKELLIGNVKDSLTKLGCIFVR